MLRFIGRRWAKINYIFRQEKEAATNELLSKLALRTAGEHRDLAAKLGADADAMDARIKELDEKLDQGFWECENGHESDASSGNTAVDSTGQVPLCACNAPKKFIKRDQMTGQEKYESDKERGEAQKMADQKRAQAKAAEEDAANSEKTAKYFRDLAQSNRSVAERVRRL
jgi:hypothetical protein